jgi:hypothetical protein
VCKNKIKCLAQYKISAKLVRLIELTLSDTRLTAKINREYTEEFKVESGVKQGDPLSATLFSVVVDVILKQLDLKRNISAHLKQCSAYADGRLVTTRTKQPLILFKN